MPELKFDQLLQSLRKKSFAPVYLLQGEEPFFIDEIASFIENKILSPEEAGFNQSVVYGRDADVLSIINLARRFPMMANNQVVLVKEAQHLKDLEALQLYFEKPLKSTILAICLKGKLLDKRKKAYKSIIDNGGVVFTSNKLYENQIPAWIMPFVKEKGFTISEQIAVMLTEYLGNDLSKIANEINKLAINLKPGDAISLQLIEQYVGINRDFNVFELQKAISVRNSQKAYQIANYFAGNPKAANFSLTHCIATLYNFFSKLWVYHHVRGQSDVQCMEAMDIRTEFQFRDYKMAYNQFSLAKTKKTILTLLEYDLRSKGMENGTADEGDLLKEMIYKILF